MYHRPVRKTNKKKEGQSKNTGTFWRSQLYFRIFFCQPAISAEETPNPERPVTCTNTDRHCICVRKGSFFSSIPSESIPSVIVFDVTMCADA